MQLLRRKEYLNLPDILKPRAVPTAQVEMQLVVRQKGDGTFLILKYFTYDRMLVADALSLVHGRPTNVRYLSPQPQLTKKTFQHALALMGGVSLLCYRVALPSYEEEDANLDRGFDFIGKHQDKFRSSGLATLRWVTKSTRENSGNPIEGWNTKLVEKAIEALRSGGALAKSRDYYPLTLKSVNRYVLRYVVGPLLPFLRKESLVLLGEQGVGKTPLMLILSFMFGR